MDWQRNIPSSDRVYLSYFWSRRSILFCFRKSALRFYRRDHSQLPGISPGFESYEEKQERKEADEVINVDAAGASENEVSVSSGTRELLEVPESVSESSEGEVSVSFSSVEKLEAPAEE